MAAFTGDFAQFDGIKYSNITHLYWGRYPYKVVVALGVRAKDFKVHAEYAEAIFSSRKRICNPPPECNYIDRAEGVSVSYFFEVRDDAEDFVQANLSRIDRVYAPRSQNAIGVALADAKVRFKSCLFFATYRWCVIFSPNRHRKEEIIEIDNWIEEYFSGELSARFMNNYGAPRRLYLAHEGDVIAAKLALSEYVKGIEKVVLHEEVEDTTQAA